MQNKYPTCSFIDHQELYIQEICIEKSCFFTPTACCKCGREKHQNHNLRSVEEIKRMLQEKLQKLNQFIKDYYQLINEYKTQIEQVLKNQFDQVEEFLSTQIYSKQILEKIASFLKKDECSEIYDAQKQQMKEFVTQQMITLANITKNIDIKFCKEYAVLENNRSAIFKHNKDKYASMNENMGLFTIDPELNNIKLKTITMSLKFQKVDWLFLGVVNDHQQNFKNSQHACITNNGTIYTTFNNDQQNMKVPNFKIGQDDKVILSINKAEKLLTICNQTVKFPKLLSQSKLYRFQRFKSIFTAYGNRGLNNRLNNLN
ncbi:hypothetical protein pb186bvf_004072 [Paramecium bursaria]